MQDHDGLRVCRGPHRLDRMPPHIARQVVTLEGRQRKLRRRRSDLRANLASAETQLARIANQLADLEVRANDPDEWAEVRT